MSIPTSRPSARRPTESDRGSTAGTTFRRERATSPPDVAADEHSAYDVLMAKGGMEKAKGAILIAEDEEGVRESLAEVLRDEGYEVAVAADGAAALEVLPTREFDLVLSDLRMPGASGIEVLRRTREIAPQALVLLMTAHATVESAVEALREGAQDYLLKPVLFEDLLHKIDYLLENRQMAWEYQMLRSQVNRHWDFDNIVGRSEAMRGVMHLVRRVAPTPSTVLITGESGVGKEVIARAVHHLSDRQDRIFLPVNCGAIPDTLLESQLFGYVRGAFTGAVNNQEGLFQRSRGGTIFLDEIGELPFSLQVKLLRVLEAKEVLPVGATTPIKTDVRIIAATNRNLATEVEAGRFREDLYYRLNVVEIEIAPLRERRDDIPALVEHCVRLHNRELKKSFKGVDGATMKLLISLPWKGNVRELDNVLEHAMILGEPDWITIKDLPRALRQGLPEEEILPSVADDLREAVKTFERGHIQGVLQQAGNDKKVAAERLGVSLSSLYRKIEELGIAVSGD
jgi:two-component system response regulator PilR (NtrC family)